MNFVLYAIGPLLSGFFGGMSALFVVRWLERRRHPMRTVRSVPPKPTNHMWAPSGAPCLRCGAKPFSREAELVCPDMGAA